MCVALSEKQPIFFLKPIYLFVVNIDFFYIDEFHKNIIDYSLFI